jgi:hypothetical protein
MKLYQPEDFRAIERNLDKIVENAEEQARRTLEPTTDECKQVQKIIFGFVQRKKRVMYGGWAYHLLLQKAQPKKGGIYQPYDCKDIEFYSPTPVQDMVELCLELEQAFPGKYTKGDEARHEGTLSVFVNFQHYCDITFMPSNIFRSIKWVRQDGFLLSPPMWILVDILRQFTDPKLSYWRLPEKTFDRAQRLLTAFPLVLEKGASSTRSLPEGAHSLVAHVAERLRTHPDRFLFLGSLAYDYYTKRDKAVFQPDTAMTVVTDRLDEAVNDVLQWVREHQPWGSPLEITEHFPFFQFWDHRVVFLYQDKPWLVLRGSANRCNPFQDVTISKRVWRIASFSVVWNDHLIESFERTVFEDKSGAVEARKRMRELLEARQRYLSKRRATVLQPGPYQEFAVECTGDVIHPNRIYFLKMVQGKKGGKAKRRSFQFYPAKNETLQVEDYPFDNISGNQVQGKMHRRTPLVLLEDESPKDVEDTRSLNRSPKTPPRRASTKPRSSNIRDSPSAFEAPSSKSS